MRRFSIWPSQNTICDSHRRLRLESAELSDVLKEPFKMKTKLYRAYVYSNQKSKSGMVLSVCVTFENVNY